MIVITILTGPYAGKIRTSEQIAKKGVDPTELLVNMAKKGIKWRITYPELAPDEIPTSPTYLEWQKADFVARIYSAALDKRPIVFAGKIWLFPDFEDLDFPLKMAELETELIRCSMLRILSDDEYGFQIESLPIL